jgi:hypothetical protein
MNTTFTGWQLTGVLFSILSKYYVNQTRLIVIILYNMVECLTFLLHIYEVSALNLGPESAYPD